MEEVRNIEQKYLAKREKNRKRKRRRKIVRASIFMILIISIVLFLSSDLSKVRSFIIYGNYYYQHEDILKIAELDHDSSYILTNRYVIAHRLEEDEMIKDAKVTKDLNGNLIIHVEEEKIVGTLISDSSSVVLAGKEKIRIRDLKEIPLARIGNFDNEQLTKLAKGFDDLDYSIIKMISEIHPYRTSYDQDMIQILMQDGNRVTTTYNGVVLLNNYLQVCEKLQGTHVCLYADEFSNTIFKESEDCHDGLILPYDAVDIPSDLNSESAQ